MNVANNESNQTWAISRLTIKHGSLSSVMFCSWAAYCFPSHNRIGTAVSAEVTGETNPDEVNLNELWA